jgi:hypothetical protein
MKRLLVLFAFITICGNYLCAQELKNDVKIFPNPATNVINILGLKNDRNASISITDTYGSQVIFHRWDISKNALNIPVFNLEKGIYLITIQSEHQRVQEKFYKQ